jgi:hypothetical protein
MESIHNFIKQFDKLAEKYGYLNSYRALKKHYSDVCSNGDFIINQLIDGLKSNNNNYYKNLLEEYKNQKDFVDQLINDYLIETIDDFLEKGLKPDPFHVENEINDYLNSKNV